MHDANSYKVPDKTMKLACDLGEIVVSVKNIQKNLSRAAHGPLPYHAHAYTHKRILFYF